MNDDNILKVPEEVNVIHWIEGKLDSGRVREEKREKESRSQQDKMHKDNDELKKTLNQAQEKVFLFNRFCAVSR